VLMNGLVLADSMSARPRLDGVPGAFLVLQPKSHCPRAITPRYRESGPRSAATKLGWRGRFLALKLGNPAMLSGVFPSVSYP
jgi:hypothetical protein